MPALVTKPDVTVEASNRTSWFVLLLQSIKPINTMKFLNQVTSSSPNVFSHWSDQRIDAEIRSAEARLIDLEALEAQEAQTPGTDPKRLDEAIRHLERCIRLLEQEECAREHKGEKTAATS